MDEGGAACTPSLAVRQSTPKCRSATVSHVARRATRLDVWMARALLVLVSGHPGAGKTTLGRALGDAMFLPHLNRDLIRDGLHYTDRDVPLDQPRTWQVFLATIRLFLDNHVSLVVDQTLYRGMVADLRELSDHGDVVNVLVRCEGAYDRWFAKVTSDPRGVPDDFGAIVERVRRQRDEMANPLPLGIPVIEVDTTSGYDPPLAELIAQIGVARQRGRPPASDGTRS